MTEEWNGRGIRPRFPVIISKSTGCTWKIESFSRLLLGWLGNEAYVLTVHLSLIPTATFHRWQRDVWKGWREQEGSYIVIVRL